MDNEQIDKLIEILRNLLKVEDMEIKDCAIESLIDMLNEYKERFEEESDL